MTLVAEVVRSGFVESAHHGSVVVLDASGQVVAGTGEVDAPVFPRSSNKPLQTVGMLRAGLVPREEADLALISGSHFGEPFHVRRVRDILAAAGLTPAALRCPAALPMSPVEERAWVRSGGEPEPVLMNCSGKHAGMLATAVANGWSLEDYRDAAHPVQLAAATAIEDLTGSAVAAVGVDGCGAPVFGFSLTALARGFLRLVSAAPDTEEGRVAAQMRAHPDLVAGTGAEDTVLMTAVPGLLSKGGAEGVQAVAVPGVGAVALKIDDGAQRARMPVLRSALSRLGIVSPLPDPVVLGGGQPVGVVRALW